MDNVRLPEKNTATRNSFEVFLKAGAGFIFGLFAAIWAVPGVPDAITQYLLDNWMQVALTVGLPSALGTGLVNLILDWQKKGLRNY